MNSDDPTYLNTRERFDDPDIAAAYAEKKNTITRGKNKREMDCIERSLQGMPAGSRVLDLPCGTGRLETMLLGRGFEVVAADYAVNMLKEAEKYLSAKLEGNSDALGRLSFEQQDVMNTTFEDDAFDIVICNRLFHHYPESATRIQVLRELKRICSGRIVLSYYNSFALSALKFRLRNAIKGRKPDDRIPIPFAEFNQDIVASGLKCSDTHAVLFGVSPQTYLVLE